jgi:hypothetical protein
VECGALFAAVRRRFKNDYWHVLVQFRVPPFFALPLHVVVQLLLVCAKAGAFEATANRQIIASSRAFIDFPRH